MAFLIKKGRVWARKETTQELTHLPEPSHSSLCLCDGKRLYSLKQLSALKGGSFSDKEEAALPAGSPGARWNIFMVLYSSQNTTGVHRGGAVPGMGNGWGQNFPGSQAADFSVEVLLLSFAMWDTSKPKQSEVFSQHQPRNIRLANTGVVQQHLSYRVLSWTWQHRELLTNQGEIREEQQKGLRSWGDWFMRKD